MGACLDYMFKTVELKIELIKAKIEAMKLPEDTRRDIEIEIKGAEDSLRDLLDLLETYCDSVGPAR